MMLQVLARPCLAFAFALLLAYIFLDRPYSAPKKVAGGAEGKGHALFAPRPAAVEGLPLPVPAVPAAALRERPRRRRRRNALSPGVVRAVWRVYWGGLKSTHRIPVLRALPHLRLRAVHGVLAAQPVSARAARGGHPLQLPVLGRNVLHVRLRVLPRHALSRRRSVSQSVSQSRRCSGQCSFHSPRKWWVR